MLSRWYTDVELRGTWSRTNTIRYDVDYYRRKLRAAARARGAEFDAVCRREPLSGDGRTLGGTFVFHVRLEKENNALKQAEALLRALSYNVICRPPRLKVDRQKSKFVTRRSSYSDPMTGVVF